MSLYELIDEVLVDHLEVLGEVVVDCPAELFVKADRVRCAQVLANLLVNAGIYGAPPVRISASASGSLAEVRVFDEGPGPTDSVRDQLFEKFVQGRGRKERGTGLGLFIVRELARGQGGDAWHESDASGRQCFVFSLPLA